MNSDDNKLRLAKRIKKNETAIETNANNISGKVSGPASSTDGNIAAFDGTNSIKDSGKGFSGADDTVITGTKGTNGNLAEWNADGDLVDSAKAVGDLSLLREYLTLTKAATQATSSGTEQVTFNGGEAVNGTSLLSRNNDQVDIEANCYARVIASIFVYGLADDKFVKFRLYHNTTKIKEVTSHKSSSVSSSAMSECIVTEPIVCSTNDYFWMEINSDDTSITISTSKRTAFCVEAWKR